MEISLGNTTYWITKCDPKMKPVVGQQFKTLEDGIDFYVHYAAVVGFDVWRSGDRKDKVSKVLHKYLVCSREGFKQVTDPEKGETSETLKRRRPSNRVGCSAHFKFNTDGDSGYKVTSFEERHTHCLCEEQLKPFMKVNRKLDMGHKEFIEKCGKTNIGPIKSFNLYGEMVGGFEHVGATSTDFKNHKREILAYMKRRGAQMLVAKCQERKEFWLDYYFEYAVDEQEQLSRIFWADEYGRNKFALFGDAMTFDATYKTNRYSLVFVPFTSMDNHKKSTTFATGLIAKEDVESYS
ncbi:PREDICTED: protein FAR1-RELATED SEQUENCE 5-like [Ipomoea nil]|uniref:protein FAR1-RELATED SEQUENCE 5-like n=1 Tax=Ipomoea nil TaxID=35883 RepID=UPI000901E253|nr:PREDICTED: protein FAR1-RELATED SEQUENCE 5-like [Ipomoea nil]